MTDSGRRRLACGRVLSFGLGMAVALVRLWLAHCVAAFCTGADWGWRSVRTAPGPCKSAFGARVRGDCGRAGDEAKRAERRKLMLDAMAAEMGEEGSRTHRSASPRTGQSKAPVSRC
jgi:hypothetical protein